jgi:hypothetical protein
MNDPTVGALGDAMALIVDRLQPVEEGLRDWPGGGIAEIGVGEVLAAVRSALGLAREGAAFGDGRTYAPRCKALNMLHEDDEDAA